MIFHSINIGALLGGILIPLLAQVNISVAYTIPACALGLGLLIFLLGTNRYVRPKPQKTALFNTIKLIGKTAICKPMNDSKKSNGGALDDIFVDGVKHLIAVIPISALIIPFNIAYSQMSTVFIIQGDAMKPAGLFDAAMMNNFDAISVLVFGFLVGTFLYPRLAKRGVHIAITHKFAIGTLLGTLAILCAIFVDYGIHAALDNNNEQLSVFLQIFSYMFIGAGEIFAVASAYDAAFTIAPKEQKGLASAINLFLIGAVPNFICIALYNACGEWFPQGNDATTEATMEAYKSSQLHNYLWVLVGISAFGIFINVLPPVKNWVEGIHRRAIENNLAGATLSDDEDSAGESEEEAAANGEKKAVEALATSTTDDEASDVVDLTEEKDGPARMVDVPLRD